MDTLVFAKSLYTAKWQEGECIVLINSISFILQGVIPILT